jgi:hypothetical protein
LTDEATTDEVLAVAKEILDQGKPVFPKMLKCLSGKAFSTEFADTFLDKFYQNWIGSCALILHYLDCADATGAHPTYHKKSGRMIKNNRVGIIDANCDIAEACATAANDVVHICERITGRTPTIDVGVCKTSAACDVVIASIPTVLQYVVQEVLKNSCQATLQKTANHMLPQMPIKVRLSADEDQVMISISDEAGGIPEDVGQHVWSYMFTTNQDDQDASALCGHGVGLPFARLYVQSLGGSLSLKSLPGSGTHAHICLPRLSAGHDYDRLHEGDDSLERFGSMQTPEHTAQLSSISV